MNILMVEDDYLLGRSTARLLEKLGNHKVRLTHKAEDVFKHCRSGLIDLVIMDVNLPGTFWQGKEVTGVELSFLLKSQTETAQLPIVLLTAYATYHNQSRLLIDALADHLCTKPITDYDAFLALLDRVSGGDQEAAFSAS